MRFGDSIRRVGGLTKRETVLSLMRAAGADGDQRTFIRLQVENPISRAAANEAWNQGVQYRKRNPPAPDARLDPEHHNHHRVCSTWRDCACHCEKVEVAS